MTKPDTPRRIPAAPLLSIARLPAVVAAAILAASLLPMLLQANERAGGKGKGIGPTAVIAIEQASRDTVGDPGDDHSSNAAIDGSGRYVAFESIAGNLVGADTNGLRDVFVRDLQTNATERVSLANGLGESSDGVSRDASISADGRYVAFESTATDMDPLATSANSDIFRYDRNTDTIVLVSHNEAGTAEGDNASTDAAISGDGRFVAFESLATDLVNPPDVLAGRDIFLYDSVGGAVTRISRRAVDGGEPDGGSYAPSVSGDGRFIAFHSDATDLVAGDTNGVTDVFVYDTQTQTTQRVSVAGDATQSNANSLNPSISGDGRSVAYESDATNLLGAGGDINALTDIFVYDRSSGDVERVSLASDGTPAAGGNSINAAISANRRIVTFESRATNLLGAATNGYTHIFSFDRSTGAIDRMSVSAALVEGNANSTRPAPNSDGTVVAFDSLAWNLLLPAAPDGNRLDVFATTQTIPAPTLPQLTIVDAAVDEDTGTADVTVTLAGFNDAGATVEVSTADGTATAGTDYTAVTPLPLTWLAGDTGDKTVTVTISPDTVFEAAETVDVSLANEAGATVTRRNATLTIQNDDPVPTLRVDAANVQEGNAGDTIAQVSVTMTGQSYLPISANLSTISGGTAVVGDGSSGTHDYRSTNNAPLAWSALETGAKTANVTVYGDTVLEEDETVRLEITGESNATVTTRQGWLTIQNDEPGISILGAAVDENTGSADVTVSLVGPNPGGATVEVSTADGTATAGTDYTAVTSQLLTWGPGVTGNQTVPVTISPDTMFELDETLTVSLANETSLPVSRRSDTVTIQNDDPVPTLSVASLAVTEGTDGIDIVAQATVTMTGRSYLMVSVNFSTIAGGSAIPGDGTDPTHDYLGVTNSTLFWTPGQSGPRNVPVTVYGDDLAESDESIRQSLSSEANATVTARQAWLRIQSDDQQVDIERQSINDADALGDGDSINAAVSAGSGRYVAFDSAATNLVAGDTNTRRDVFVRDRLADTIERVSVTPAAGQGVNGDSTNPSISSDARYVAFESDATGLNGLADDAVADVFLRDRTGNTLTLVSQFGGNDGDGPSVNAVISDDGRFVAFESDATNLFAQADALGNRDIFLYSRVGDTNVRASLNTTGSEPNGDSFGASISSNGRYVAYHSDATDLIANDANGATDIFIYDTVLGTTQRVSLADDGTAGNGNSFNASLSADGRYVAFESDATNLLGAGVDTNGLRDIFVYDRATSTIERVNVSSTGAEAAGGASRLAAISADARIVTFESDATNLLGGGLDANGVTDTFSFDRATRAVNRISVDSTGGEADAASNRPSVSGDGTVVAFDSAATNLVPPDPSNRDVYVVEQTIASAPPPELAILDAVMTEDTGSVTVTITLAGFNDNGASVELNTADGTAAAGTDYQAIVGQTLTWGPGETGDKTVTVTITPDVMFELDETIAVSLANPTSATISDGDSTITVQNDDSLPSLSVAALSLDEGNGNSTVQATVTMTGQHYQAVTVLFSTILGGTAVDGNGSDPLHDYRRVTNSQLTWSPGETGPKTQDIDIFGDTLYEGDDTIRLDLSNEANAGVVMRNSWLTLRNEDTKPVVSLADAAVAETNANWNHPLIVTVTGASDQAITVDLNTTAAGSATATEDYAAHVNTQVLWDPGETGNKTINLAIVGDTQAETDETVTFSLDNPSANVDVGTVGAVTIQNDDGTAPSLSIDDLLNTSEGIGAVNVTVRLSATSLFPVTVTLDTVDGTAAGGSDFTAIVGQQVTVAPGDLFQTAVLNITDDDQDEPDGETAQLLLSDPHNATIADGTGALTIQDNDAKPTLRLLGVSVIESSGIGSVEIFMTGKSASPVTVDFTTAAGSATVGTDYYEATSVVQWAPGQTGLQSVPVTILLDELDEANETVQLLLSNVSASATITDASATLTILDDDVPTITVDNVTAAEGAFATVTVSLVGESNSGISVDFATGGGGDTATAGDDYLSKATRLTWPARTSGAQTVLVQLLQDDVTDDGETVALSLSNPNNAVVGGGGTLTITDVAFPPLTIAVNAAAATEGDGTATATFTMTGSYYRDISVDFFTTDGAVDPATDTVDYAGVPGAPPPTTITWPKGSTGTQTYQVTIHQDTDDETAETVTLNIANPTAPAAITTAQATLTILDDDEPIDIEGIERVSLNDAGDEGTSSSSAPSISTSGRFVAFASDAANLVAGDTNAVADIFVYDRQNDTVERVSTAYDGAQALGHSYNPAISGDGAYVAFESDATNLVPGDSNQNRDIFVVQRATGNIARVSVDGQGLQVLGDSYNASISRDGAYIAFESSSSGLVADDLNGVRDIFVLQRGTTNIARVSVDNAGIEADGASFNAAIDPSGFYVAYESVATNLVTGDTNGVRDIFVFDRTTSTVGRTSVDGAGGESNAASYEPDLSIGGRYVTFASDATNLVGNDVNGVRDIFVRDRQESTIERVSLSTAGAEADTNCLNPTISTDGRFVAFESTSGALSRAAKRISAASDVLGFADVFVHDRPTDETRRVSVDAAGTEADAASGSATISGDGEFVAFDSVATNLVANDANGVSDVFVSSLKVVPEISVGGVSVSENAATADVTIVLSGTNDDGVTADFSTSDATATAGEDYVATSAELSWLPGDTSVRVVTITLTNDDLDEADETVSLDLSNAANAAVPIPSATLTIQDNDPTPSIAVAEDQYPEGVGNARVLVALTGQSSSTITVDCGTIAGGSATAGDGSQAGDDYVAIASQTLTWAPGETGVKNFIVQVHSDGYPEDDETVFIELSNVSAGATVADASGTLTILNDDGAPPALSFRAAAPAADPPYLLSLPESTGSANIEILLSQASGLTVSVEFSTANLTATEPGDYTAVANQLVTFNPGELSKVVQVSIIDDDLSELDEDLQLQLVGGSARNAAIGTPTETLTIEDDDPAPTLAVMNATEIEKSGTAAVTVVLTGKLGSTITADLTSSAGTATAGVDYQNLAANPTQLSWAPGETGAKTANLTLIEDTLDEPNETVTLTLSNQSPGAQVSIADAIGILTILDDDIPTIVVSNTVTAGENAGQATVNVTMTGRSLNQVTVDLATADGSATANEDYIPIAQTLTWNAGQTGARAVVVTLIDDVVVEGDETVDLLLSNPTNSIIGDDQGTLTITDNDVDSVIQIERVSIADDQTEGDLQSNASDITPDGRYVVFDSNATTLVANDANGQWDIFRYDRQNGAIQRLSVAADQVTGGDRSSRDPVINADGSVVAFQSLASNLVTESANLISSVFVSVGSSPGTTERVSLNTTGSEPNSDSVNPSISADGNYVAFQSNGSDLAANDNNGTTDVFVYNRQAQTTTRVSVALSGIEEPDADAVNPSISISGNGRFVAFESGATNLVASDTNGVADVFVYDLDAGTTRLVSVPPTYPAEQANGASAAPCISADGRYVAFESDATNLVVDDLNGVRDIFVFDLLAGTTVRASVASDGTVGNLSSANPALSPNGDTVAFSSRSTNLVAGDDNGLQDIFVNNLASGATERISVAGLAGTQANGASKLPRIGSNGRFVVFASDATNLLGAGADNNAVEDVFVVERALAGVPVILVDNATYAEPGGPDPLEVTLSLTLLGATSDPGGVTVEVNTADNTALEGVDYNGITPTVVAWAAGETGSKNVSVPVEILADAFSEFSETIDIVPGNPSSTAVLGGDRGTLTITDAADGPVPQVTIAPQSFNESDGVVGVVVTVLPATHDHTISVEFTTADGATNPATDGGDYTGITDPVYVVQWAQGEVGDKFVPLTILDDAIFEVDEQITATIANATGAQIQTPPLAPPDTLSATLTILDDDQQPTISIGDVTVDESDGNAIVSVTLTGTGASNISVTFATAAGPLNPATDGTDFEGVAVGKTITWIAGQSGTRLERLELFDDSLDEPSETVALNLSNPTGGASLAVTSAALTILDNDATPTLTLASASADEGETPQIEITKTGLSQSTVTVWMRTVDGSAIAGSDYQAVDQVVTWLTNETGVKTVDIPTIDNDAFEPTEVVLLSLYSPTNANIVAPSATITILDDDPAPTLVVDSLTVLESGGDAQVAITLSGESTLDVSVDFDTANGTAAGGVGEDYANTSATLSWPAGATGTQIVTVPVQQDSLYEGNETVLLVLTNAVNAQVLGGGVGTLMILDDDPAPVVTIVNDGDDTVSVQENDANSYATISVTLANKTSRSVRVDISTASGTATAGITPLQAGEDYASVSTVLTWDPDTEGTKSFNVPILDDQLSEGNETVPISITTITNATAANSQITLIIVDDEQPPSFTLTTADANEDAGSAIVTATLVGNSQADVSIKVLTADATATADLDYRAVNTTITWAPGDNADKIVLVPILSDRLIEGNETLTVKLTAASDENDVKAQDTITIIDDDVAPDITIADVSVSEGAGVGVVAVSLGAPAPTVVTVDVASADVTAEDGTDYTGLPPVTRLVWLPGQSGDRTVQVPILEDTVDELDETLLLTLSNATNSNIADAQGVLTILDNDASPDLKIWPAQGQEGDGLVDVRITISGESDRAVTVEFSVTDDTAELDADYDFTGAAAQPVQLVWQPGDATSRTVQVNIIDDALGESTEAANLVLGNAANATILTGQSTLTIADNEEPLLVFRLSSSLLKIKNGRRIRRRRGGLLLLDRSQTKMTAIRVWRSGNLVNKFYQRQDWDTLGTVSNFQARDNEGLKESVSFLDPTAGGYVFRNLRGQVKVVSTAGGTVNVPLAFSGTEFELDRLTPAFINGVLSMRFDATRTDAILGKTFEQAVVALIAGVAGAPQEVPLPRRWTSAPKAAPALAQTVLVHRLSMTRTEFGNNTRTVSTLKGFLVIDPDTGLATALLKRLEGPRLYETINWHADGQQPNAEVTRYIIDDTRSRRFEVLGTQNIATQGVDLISLTARRLKGRTIPQFDVSGNGDMRELAKTLRGKLFIESPDGESWQSSTMTTGLSAGRTRRANAAGLTQAQVAANIAQEFLNDGFTPPP